MASTLLWTFGLVVMINQRLAADVVLEARNMRSIFATSRTARSSAASRTGSSRTSTTGFTLLSGFSRDEAIGRSTVDLGLWVDPAARDGLVRDISEAGSLPGTPMTFRRKDGSTIDCIVAASTLTLDDEPYLITVTRDVTQQRRMEAELQREAATDSLTGLPNRRHFLATCERELRRSTRSGGSSPSPLLDIDHFKDINDGFGHATGDAAVVAFAQGVLSRIRDIDTFGRLGGDEFALLLPDADLDRAVAAVERVRADLSAQACDVGGEQVEITFSAGVTVIDGELDTVDFLLARADKALYEAKAQGRNRVIAASPQPGVPVA